MDALKLISESSMKENVPQFNVGDTIKVHVRIKEGDKSRIQVFEGTVIAKKHGGINETFTVRRVAHGCGIERVFPLPLDAVKSAELSSTTSETELVRLLRSRNRSAKSGMERICRYFCRQVRLLFLGDARSLFCYIL